MPSSTDTPAEAAPDAAPVAGRAGRISTALRTAFAPAELRIDDESARHAGHAGAAPGGETHFSVTMVTGAFTGVSRVARSRAVHAALKDEFASGLHALSLRIRAPDEP
jgi:BolA protein